MSERVLNAQVALPGEIIQFFPCIHLWFWNIFQRKKEGATEKYQEMIFLSFYFSRSELSLINALYACYRFLHVAKTIKQSICETMTGK